MTLVNLVNEDPLKTAQAIFRAQGYVPLHNELIEAIDHKSQEKVVKYFRDWADSVANELNALERKAAKLPEAEATYKECLKTKLGKLNDYIQILKLVGEIKGQ